MSHVAEKKAPPQKKAQRGSFGELRQAGLSEPSRSRREAEAEPPQVLEGLLGGVLQGRFYRGGFRGGFSGGS